MSPGHIVLSSEPLNSEPHSSELVKHRLTPSADLYHRNHGAVMHIAPESYRLSLSSVVFNLDTKQLSLNDVKEGYNSTCLEGILLCAGNRRKEMDGQHGREVEGLKWDRSAIANARWEGAPLRTVLLEWGVPDDHRVYNGLHCHFECDQDCEEDRYYAASIPLSLAMNPKTPVLLAYKMNDEDLSVEHGGPLRVYVPSAIGARSVKWVQRIVIKKDESQCFYQTSDYKVLPSEATAETKMQFMKETPAMIEYDMNSAICSPEPDTHVRLSQDGKLEVKGYAYGAQGTRISAVHVAVLPASSTDTLSVALDNASQLPASAWTSASLEHGEPAPGDTDRTFAWTLWTADVTVPVQSGRSEEAIMLVARCVDANGREQPQQTTFNIRGIGECGWSAVKFMVQR